jgi:hypothetical protein
VLLVLMVVYILKLRSDPHGEIKCLEGFKLCLYKPEGRRRAVLVKDRKDESIDRRNIVAVCGYGSA